MTDEQYHINPPEWLNKSYIENALKKSQSKPDFKIINLHIKPAVKAGDNYGSQIFRASIDYVEDSNFKTEKMSFIMKTNPIGDVSDKMEEQDLFGKESHMMLKIIPNMEKILKKVYPDMQPLAARCLFFGKEPSNVLIMEDLKASNFENADRFNGLNIEESNMLLKTLAKYHAASIHMLKNNPEILANYSESMWRKDNEDMLKPFISGCLNGLLEETKLWEDCPSKYIDLLEGLKDTIMDKIYDCFNVNDDDVKVLSHGDCWINNFMYARDEGNITGFRFVDFQLSCITSPTVDLLYFIFSSPNASIRLSKIDDFLATYHETFSKTLQALEIPVPFNLDGLKTEFKKRLFFGFVSEITIYPITVLQSDDAPDVNDFMEASSKRYLYKTKEFKNLFYPSFEYFLKEGIFA